MKILKQYQPFILVALVAGAIYLYIRSKGKRDEESKVIEAAKAAGLTVQSAPRTAGARPANQPAGRPINPRNPIRSNSAVHPPMPMLDPVKPLTTVGFGGIVEAMGN